MQQGDLSDVSNSCRQSGTASSASSVSGRQHGIPAAKVAIQQSLESSQGAVPKRRPAEEAKVLAAAPPEPPVATAFPSAPLEPVDENSAVDRFGKLAEKGGPRSFTKAWDSA